MDNPSYADQPPPYTEATFYPPIPVTASPANCSLHPNYSTPPPTYREAVTSQPDPFPVLTPPTQQLTGIHLHQSTQIVNGASFQQTNQRIPSTVVYIDPVSVGPLGDAPCMTRCSNCRQNITTIVTYKPGMAAWSMCLLFTLLGLICGCCLIPFLLRGFQDAHHTCPLCHAHLYIHIR
uniref:Si:dkeyp-75b4.8 n=1 Tax=Esox lucius TaxID=8010 RepID=A0A3P8YKS5_ESOLU